MSYPSRGALSRPFAGAAEAWPPVDDATRVAKPADPHGSPPNNLDELYRRHRTWLVDALRRRFGAERAEDLSQETFVRARSYAEGGIGHPRALLMTIATNLARDQSRRDAVQHAAVAAASDRSHPVRPDAMADDLHVRQVLLDLPPKFRDVLLLSKIGGLTNREIAQRYGVSVRAIDKRMQKAVALLLTRLRD